jgi:beta-lactamase regulating signal transducer with metallopeptidase domain/predicted  nucleic acid-binding Zn-ribbon protein
MDPTFLLKATLVLSAILVAAMAMRRAPAHVRHRYWTAAFVAILSLPVLVRTLPQFRVPVAWTIESPAAVPQRAEPAQPSADSPREITITESDAVAASPLPDGAPLSRRMPALDRMLSAIWMLGVMLALGALIVSLLRVRRLTRQATELTDQAWLSAACDMARRFALRRRVRLLVSDAVRTPMAGGIWRPSIFLPTACRRWTAEQRGVVLAHEVAHLASRDPLRQVVARLAVAVYWFHPLAWLAAHQAGAAREEACDAAVIALGTRPSVYAQVLLDLAETMQRRSPLLAALPIVQRSLLETRLMAILKDARPSTPRLAAIPLLVVGLFTLAVAAAQPSVRPVAAPAAAWGPAVPGGLPGPGTTQVPAPSLAAAQPTSTTNCWREGGYEPFNGSMSSSRSGGGTIVYEQIGSSGTNRVIQKTFGDLRVCLVADGVGDRTWATPPSQWLGAATRFVLETRRGSAIRQLSGERQPPSGLRVTWRVDGRERPLDSAAEQWRDRLLAVLDTTWEISSLRGQVSSLHGEISSIRGHESSLRGEISSLHGEVSSMHGRISSLRGEESSLRGEISSIHGHVSSLRGAISSERGAISSLNASRYEKDADRAASISRHETQIARLEKEIGAYDEGARVAAVEREIAALDTARKVAAVEAEIRDFNLDAKVAKIEKEIAGLDVQRKIAALERQIETLDADRRVRQLEDRRDAQLKQLEAALAAIR